MEGVLMNIPNEIRFCDDNHATCLVLRLVSLHTDPPDLFGPPRTYISQCSEQLFSGRHLLEGHHGEQRQEVEDQSDGPYVVLVKFVG
jgi:hypothetical protein